MLTMDHRLRTEHFGYVYAATTSEAPEGSTIAEIWAETLTISSGVSVV